MSLLLLFNAPAASGSTGTAFNSFVEAGMFLGTWEIGDYLTWTACIHDSTGAAADADSVPTYAVYEDETAAAIATGSMAKLGSVTGYYTERVQLLAATGFEAGKAYSIRVAATVGGVVAAATHLLQIDSDIAAIKAKTDLIVSGVFTVASPVATNLNVTTYMGDDYDAADGRQLDWTVASTATLTGGTVAVVIAGVDTYTGSVVDETTIRLELTAAQTAAIPVGKRKYQVTVTQTAALGSDVITLVEGTWTSNARVSE